MLNSFSDVEDSPAQQPPIGYAHVGWHVDDGTGLACDKMRELDPTKNRVARYIIGTIETVYATTMTGWHGQRRCVRAACGAVWRQQGDSEATARLEKVVRVLFATLRAWAWGVMNGTPLPAWRRRGVRVCGGTLRVRVPLRMASYLMATSRKIQGKSDFGGWGGGKFAPRPPAAARKILNSTNL